MENTFKSSVFGGFNRDDVIRYIEKTSLESKQQIEALEQESDGLCRENAELRDKLAAAERERDKFAESYSTASSAQDALKKGLTAAQETISELRAQIEEGAQKLASAKADCDRQLKAKEEAAEQRIAELEAQHAERLSAAEQERNARFFQRVSAKAHQKIGKNPDNNKNDGVDDAQKIWLFYHEIQSRAFVIIFFQDNPAPKPRMAYLAGIFFVHVTL